MSRYSSDDSQNFGLRLSVIQAIAFMIFIVLGARFWVLQVVQHETFAQAAEANRIRDIAIPAPRGSILDRNGKVLVDSRPIFALVVSREDLRKERVPELLAAMQENLGVDPEFAREQMYDNPEQRSRPVTVKTKLSDADRAWVEAHELEYPELQVELQPQRIYPLGEKLAHVLGYVGEISKKQLEANLPEFEGNRPGDVVGQAGIERSRNPLLTGRDGYRRVIVDSRGRFVREIERVEPTPGQNLYTTIDLDLQTVAETKLAETKLTGAVVVLDPRNGEVLAMVSLPSYNPELFAGGITPQNYALLRDNPDRPLRNRGIQDIYPPGSTWKGIMAMAGLSEKVMKPEEPVACGGGIQVGNKFTSCNGSHGAPDVERALAVSCNGYFYRVGLKLGVDKINKWSTTMGLGKKTGIDLPNEQAGYIPSRDIKLRFKPKSKPDNDPQYQWKDIDTVFASIGQGYDRPTPLQMVHAFAGIATNGHFTTPHLLHRASAVGQGEFFRPEVTYQDENIVDIPLDPSAYHHVVAGMREVVTNGTARRAEVPGFDVCGKTGTAQVASIRTGATGKQKEHAWFVGFAPQQNPELAWAIISEHGGHGGVVCAPIAQAIVAEYVKKTKGYDPLAGGTPSDVGAAVTEASAETADATEPDSEDASGDTVQTTTNDAVEGIAPEPTILPQADPTHAAVPVAPQEPATPQIDPLGGIMRTEQPAQSGSPPPRPGTKQRPPGGRRP